ncbi:hypothetical protein, partial [Ferrovum myxofaciens]|uniref:hypothetical protein n=1 Tax=Ferrovum myxofaciens TaxID=416213 RepID=UPI000557B48E
MRMTKSVMASKTLKSKKTDATIEQYKKRVVGILRQIASESNMEEITPSMIVHWLSRHAKYQTDPDPGFGKEHQFLVRVSTTP